MRVPGRTASWMLVVTLLLLATGVGLASVATSPSGHSARKARPPTSLSPSPLGSTTLPPTTSTTVPAPSEGIAQVAFLNPEDGYGLDVKQDSGTCVSAVASTTNGGSTFSKPVPVTTWTCADGYQETSLAFDGAGDGFVYGPGLHVSHDGGVSWTDQSPPGAVLAVVPMGRSIWMLHTPCSNPRPGPCTVTLDESNDGGRTWAPSATFPSVMAVGNEAPPWLSLKWLVRTSSLRAFVVIPTTDTAVTLLSTFDGAHTWHQGLVPCLGGWAESLSQGFDQTLWLACAGQPSAGSQLKSVVRSFDGGRDWVQGSPCPPVVTSTTYPPCADNGLTPGYLSDIAALSGTTAFRAGGRSWVDITHDGGKTWELTNPSIGNGDVSTGGLFFVTPQDGWVLLNPLGTGVLWRTTDGGNSWHQVWPTTTSSPTTTSPSGLVPALQTHNPMVVVTPASGLTNGQHVDVRVTGFGLGGKVWLSECAGVTDANGEGCGHGLPKQTLLGTDDTGSGNATFQVESSASSQANDFGMTHMQPCVDNCVLVATLGGGFGFAYTTLHFAPAR